MDIRKTLEAKKREIEAKILAAASAKDPPSVSGTLVNKPFDGTPGPSHPSSFARARPSFDGASEGETEIPLVVENVIHALARQVVREGAEAEERARRDHGPQDPVYQFLFNCQSAAYLQYRRRIEELKRVQLLASGKRPADSSSDFAQLPTNSQPAAEKVSGEPDVKRRKSRWGPEPVDQGASLASPSVPVLTDEMIRTTQLVHLRRQLAAKEVVLKAKAGVVDDEYGGPSLEHRTRALEMEKTKEKAQQLTKPLFEGKHHLQDFIPKEELLKFQKRSSSPTSLATSSQYEENKLDESNLGYQMLKKFGWKEGGGLGSTGAGIAAPISSVAPVERAGLGTKKPDEPDADDDEFSLYRKRMMLAYKYRPNPLNNPRRPYY